MKKLQNTFTTPEQSKRLLEIGVPADSADIIYYHTPDSQYDPFIITEERHIRDMRVGRGFPCWSVGRLIEIYLLLREVDELEYVFNLGRDHIEDIVRMYEKTASKLDFSKLEE